MLALVLSLQLASPCLAQDASFLMLGNSYTQQNDLQLLLAQALQDVVPSWEQVEGQRQTQGGATLADHAAQADGSMGETRWRELLVTGKEAGSWDFVALQDQSQIPGFPEHNPYWVASRDGAVILDGLVADGDGDIVFLLTWGRRDGDSSNPELYPDFGTMQERLLEGYLAYAAAVSSEKRQAWIIPAGLAFAAVHDDLLAKGQDPTEEGTLFFGLYAADGSHPSPTGSYLAALTGAVALTGRSAMSASIPEGIDEQGAASLQAAAEQAVFDDPFGQIPYPWAWDYADWTQPDDVEAAGFVISDPALRPLVRVEEEVHIEGDLLLGALHGGALQGAGRLLLRKGAEVQVDGALQLGHDGEGELVVEGGSISAAQLQLGNTAGSLGSLVLSAGSVSVGAAAQGNGTAQLLLQGGDLSLESGELAGLEHSAGSLQITGALRLGSDYALQESASLLLAPQPEGEVPLTVEGAAILQGTLTLDLQQVDGQDGRADLVAAATIVAEQLSCALEQGYALELEKRQEGQALVLVRSGDSGGADSGADSPPADSRPADSAGEGQDGTPDEGCACGHGGPFGAAWAWLGALLLGTARRGRAPTISPSSPNSGSPGSER